MQTVQVVEPYLFDEFLRAEASVQIRRQIHPLLRRCILAEMSLSIHLKHDIKAKLAHQILQYHHNIYSTSNCYIVPELVAVKALYSNLGRWSLYKHEDVYGTIYGSGKQLAMNVWFNYLFYTFYSCTCFITTIS